MHVLQRKKKHISRHIETMSLFAFSFLVAVFLGDHKSKADFLYNCDLYNLTNGEYVFLIADTISILSFDDTSPQYEQSIKLGWGRNLNLMLTNYRDDIPNLLKVVRAMKRSFLLSAWVTDTKQYKEFQDQVIKKRDELFDCTGINQFIKRECISHVVSYLFYNYGGYTCILLKIGQGEEGCTFI